MPTAMDRGVRQQNVDAIEVVNMGVRVSFRLLPVLPGFGRVWVAVDGPFNQHLVRDTGAAYLMIAALAGLGLVRPLAVPPFAVGFATLCFNLAHGIYHLTHLGMYGALDTALKMVVLGLAVACSVWLMTPVAQMRV